MLAYWPHPYPNGAISYDWSWPRKSGHLYNPGTYVWSQNVRFHGKCTFFEHLVCMPTATLYLQLIASYIVFSMVKTMIYSFWKYSLSIIGMYRRKCLEGQRGQIIIGYSIHVVQKGHAYPLVNLSCTMESIHFYL